MHSIRAYSMRARPLRSNEYAQLSNIHNHDLIDTIVGALQSLQQSYKIVEDDKVNKVFKVEKLEINGRYISGQLVSGPFGFSSNILDTSNAVITYNKSVKEAEIIPLYFMFYVGENSHGFAIFQRHGLNGIKTFLHDELWCKFRESITDHILQITPIVDQEAFNKILDEGEIKKIRFVNYVPPDDIADVVQGLCTEDEEGEIEIQIKPKKNGVLANARESLRRLFNEQPSGILTLLDEQYRELKVEIEKDGQKRTLNFSNPSEFHMDIVISDEVEITAGGHPDFNSLNVFSKSVIDELLNKVAGVA